MRRRLAAVVVGVSLVTACAKRPPVMPPMPVAPHHPEYVFPALPDGTVGPLATRMESGWRYLQSDNLRSAERDFSEALKQQPAFHPADTAMGYVQLAQREPKAAVTRFDRALEREASYVPALVGRGLAYLELKRDTEALASFEAALKADPARVELQGRIDVLRFRALQDNLARAKAASDASRWDEARDAYGAAIAASPESSFLYRDLGLIDLRAGDPEAALEHFQKAVALDPNDARSYAQIGTLLEQKDPVGALQAFEKARAIDPSEVREEIVGRLRERAAFAKMPAEYQGIVRSTSVTRAEVAALVGVRLGSVIAQTRPRQVVVTDIRGNWAQQWILPVVRAGIMDTQPNYTFQPSGRVRRGELAQTVSRLLTLIAARKPALAKTWQDTRPKIADVSAGHLSYPAVSQAVAAGVMPLENGSFQLLRSVSGAEAIDIIGRLEALARQ